MSSGEYVGINRWAGLLSTGGQYSLQENMLLSTGGQVLLSIDG